MGSEADVGSTSWGPSRRRLIKNGTRMSTWALIALGLSTLSASAVIASAVPAISVPTLKKNPNGAPYLIGAIAWPGFKQGQHSAGWRRLEHYSDRKPLLGFYDQDSVEVWDWQIKFAREHGISYFAFVWDRGSLPHTPITQQLRSHALEAFKQSQFIDQIRFCIIWNQVPKTDGEQDFENNVWPKMREEITHSRYLVINNRPVIYVNNPGAITDATQVIDRLRTLVAEETNLGNPYIVTARGQKSYADFGFWYANSQLDCGGDFGPACDQPAKAAIIGRFDGHTIGTLSMGWDKDPASHKQFHGVAGREQQQRVWRFTIPGYKDMAVSFKNAMDNSAGLISRLALAGAWDEWVEGHFIAPREQDSFGYLKKIREVFTEMDNDPYHWNPLNQGFGPYDLNFILDAARYTLSQPSGDTAFDSSGWERHAPLQGDPIWRPSDGPGGTGALELDGIGDYVLLAPHSPGGGPGFMHDYVGLRTVSMWVKASTTNGTQVLYDEGGVNYGMAMRIRNGILQGAIRRVEFPNIVSSSYPPDGDWHHVALAYQSRDEDGTERFYIRLYLDGDLVDELWPNGGWRLIRTHGDAAALGARAGGDAFGDSPTGGYFQGLISDMRIVPKELRPNEIAVIAGKSVAIVDSKSGGITYKAKGIVPGELYYWTDNGHPGDRGGSVKQTVTAGNEAIYRFAGCSVNYIARKGPFAGNVAVGLDGVNQGTFDLYAPEVVNQKVIFAKNVTPGSHTIKITATGTKNPASQGRNVNVDFFQYTLQTPDCP